MEALRVIFDRSASGPWNMAVDQALLQSAERDGLATLRFYGWAEPTVSLGYFQAHAQRQTHRASLSCPLVRRASGGGAIVHDRELTYSFAAPTGAASSSRARSTYDLFHRTLIEVLSQWNVPAKLCTFAATPRPGDEPFLCFSRRSRGDVVVGDVKIAGSAQRRHKRALLQHGSVLLRKSIRAPELGGLAEVAGVDFDAADLAQRWLRRLIERLSVGAQPAGLSEEEISSAKHLQSERFAARMWTCRR